MSDIRIVEFPKCRMVSSGYSSAGMEEDGRLKEFERWMNAYDKQRVDRWFSREFMMYGREEKAVIRYYAIPDNATVDCEFDVIPFEGGLYAASVVFTDDFKEEQRVYSDIKEWVYSSAVFELDERPGHYDLSHVITPASVHDAMGKSQLEMFVPIKIKN